MAEPKLLFLLKSLSKEELKSLDKFLQSPYFNTNLKLNELYHHLRNHHDKTNKNGLEKEKIFRLLYPDKPYNDLRFRQYLSALSALVEEFLSVSRFQKESGSKQHFLMKEMIGRDAEKHFKQALSGSEKNGGDNFEDAEFYLNQFRREELRNQFVAQNAQRKNRLIGQPDFAKTIHHLDTFYLITKLKYCCQLLNYKTIGALEKETILMDEILELLNRQDYTSIPAIDIYHKILLTLTQPENETNFSALLKTLEKNDRLFGQSEVRDMYIYAQNFCIRQINKGKADYIQRVLDIYKILLRKKIILENGQLSPWDYKNIVVSGLRSKEFKWVENFIKTYKDFLPEEERENAYTYNFAKFYFYKKDYSKVLQLLQTVEYNDVFYSLDSKAMLLKTYYELDELDSLYSMMDSFRIFLRRKKALSDHHIKTYKNLIKITSKLSHSIPGDKKRIALLEAEIEKTKPIADIGWVKEKLEDLR